MEKQLEKAKKILEFAPEKEVDQYSMDQLEKRIYKWRNEEVNYLSRLEYFINGKEYKSFLEAVYDVEDYEKMKIKFLQPNLDGKWNFSRPTKELKEKDGKGVCISFDYDPTSLDKWAKATKSHRDKVMVRAFLTKFFYPISINTKSSYHQAEEIPRQYDPKLKKVKDLWEDIRSGVIPFEIRFSMYTKDDRYSLVMDPFEDRLKPHPLKDITLIQNKDRNALEYLKFDILIANIDLPPLTKNILELLFEADEMRLFDIAHSFKLDRNVAENNLKSLESKGLIEKSKRVHYNINMDKVFEEAEKIK